MCRFIRTSKNSEHGRRCVTTEANSKRPPIMKLGKLCHCFDIDARILNTPGKYVDKIKNEWLHLIVPSDVAWKTMYFNKSSLHRVSLRSGLCRVLILSLMPYVSKDIPMNTLRLSTMRDILSLGCLDYDRDERPGGVQFCLPGCAILSSLISMAETTPGCGQRMQPCF
jgi:hypothetical protein